MPTLTDERHGLAADRRRLGEHDAEALRHLLGHVGRVELLDQHRELVAAEPRDDRVGAGALLESSAQRGEQLVADVMAEPLVDRPEIVHVEEEHGDQLLGRHVEHAVPLLRDASPSRERSVVRARRAGASAARRDWRAR